MILTHYVIVLRGMTLGQTAAQVAHAAGESFYLLHSGVAQLLERPEARTGGGEVGGGNPSTGARFDPARVKVVVLGARTSLRLEKLSEKLGSFNIPHVLIREPDPPFNGLATALGVMPGDEARLKLHVSDFHMLPDPTESAA